MHIDKRKLHHSYIYEGSGNSSFSLVLNFIKNNFGFDLGHPDLFFIESIAFGVDEARSVIQKNIQRPAVGDSKVIMISLNSISHQAQNNLLKVLEEPNPGTYIFIIAPNLSIFLPTIKSRIHVLNDFVKDLKVEDVSVPSQIPQEALPESIKKEAEVFIKSNHVKRLELVKKIIKDKDDENIDDRYIMSFVKELVVLYKKDKDFSKEESNKSKKILNALDYIYDTSSSKKMILEYLALSL